jgi:hypothetical protein
MVFGAAAWKVAVRDQFIGWSVQQRCNVARYFVDGVAF